jgi:hypothetical protein
MRSGEGRYPRYDVFEVEKPVANFYLSTGGTD